MVGSEAQRLATAGRQPAPLVKKADILVATAFGALAQLVRRAPRASLFA
jgi:hypothetical protein